MCLKGRLDFWLSFLSAILSDSPVLFETNFWGEKQGNMACGGCCGWSYQEVEGIFSAFLRIGSSAELNISNFKNNYSIGWSHMHYL